jgi:hypothetical protein
MRTRLGLVLFVLSCGGSQPAPQQVIANKPVGPTCQDVGVVLRGHVEPDAGSDANIGRIREAAISNACEIDRWTPDVLGCIASSTQPDTCLEKLTAVQRKSYEAKVAAWDAQYGGGAYGGLAYAEDNDRGADLVAEPYIECHDAIGDVTNYPPAVALKDIDRDWDIALRRTVLQHSCDFDNWDTGAKKCFQAAMDPTAANACMTDKLDAPIRAALTAKLAETETLATKGAAARKKGSSIDCKKLVAAHYSDAAWNKKLENIKGKDRVRIIKESRALMTKACTTDNWPDTLRACVIVGGDDTCFAAASLESLWGFPASGVVISSGIAECDQYMAEMLKLSECKSMAQEARNALRQAHEVGAQWANLPAETRATLGEACKSGLEAMKQMGQSMCP